MCEELHICSVVHLCAVYITAVQVHWLRRLCTR